MVREYISWFESLDIYQEWVKNLPEPLCNAAFASAAFLGAAIFLLTAAADRILLVRWNARQRKARRRMEEQRRQEMEEQREQDRHSREGGEQMDLYLRFLVTAQMQNFTSLQGITFGQWKSQMIVEQAADGAGRAEGSAEGETGTRTGGGTEDAETGPDRPVELKDAGYGYISGGEGSVPLFGNLGLPGKRAADDAAGEAAGQKASPESLRSVDMAAVMEQIRRDGNPGAAEGLSSEQQRDFAEVLARMREDAERQDCLERFQREKSEIIKNNLSVLDRTAYPIGEDPAEGKSAGRKAADEEMERRKAAAREAIRQEERLARENGKKKGLFGRKK